jgi:membrane protein implicated in regulation of membrane protease activity
MTAAVIWLVAALVLICAEALSGEFVLLMLGGGALVAAGVAWLGAPVLVTALVFGGASVLLVFAVRPALKRRLAHSIHPGPMHSAALVGKGAVVVARVDATGGQIKIGGDLWSARAMGDAVLEPGERATVVDISGATALIVAQD